jgi:hypothetical protein
MVPPPPPRSRDDAGAVFGKVQPPEEAEQQADRAPYAQAAPAPQAPPPGAAPAPAAPARSVEEKRAARREPPSPPQVEPLSEAEKLRMRAKLENRMNFLVDLRQKLEDDPEMFNFVDSMIANQVKTAEKRQRTYSVVVTTGFSVVSLVAGWLLSAVPLPFMHLVGH